MLLDLKLARQIRQEKLLGEDEKFSIRDVLGILTNRAYLLIMLLCVTFYAAVFPFVAYAPDFFLNKFGMSLTESGRITSLLPLGTMFFTPLFGFLIDRKGRAASAMIIGALVLVVVHLVFALTPLKPHFFMILLGVSFSLVP